MKLRLKLTTLSDTLIGSARSFGTIIDSDIVFDEMGLPYIPAKRMKGLFRNAFEDLINTKGFAEFSPAKLESVKEIFGKEGGNEVNSSTIFDSLYLEESKLMADHLKYLYENFDKVISKQQVMEHFTQLRSQTAIDPNTGIAKDHSLRTFRVLKKGFSFSGNLEVAEDSELSLELWSFAALYIKRIGSMRNRGFGKVKIELFDDEGNSLNENVVTKLEEKCKN